MLVSVYQSLQATNTAAAEMSYRLTGEMGVKGLPAVQMSGVMTPNDLNPGAINAALFVNDRFSKVYGNALEQPVVTGLRLKMEASGGAADGGAGDGAAERDGGAGGRHDGGGGDGASLPGGGAGGAGEGEAAGRADAGADAGGGERWRDDGSVDDRGRERNMRWGWRIRWRS